MSAKFFRSSTELWPEALMETVLFAPRSCPPGGDSFSRAVAIRSAFSSMRRSSSRSSVSYRLKKSPPIHSRRSACEQFPGGRVLYPLRVPGSIKRARSCCRGVLPLSAPVGHSRRTPWWAFRLILPRHHRHHHRQARTYLPVQFESSRSMATRRP